MKNKYNPKPNIKELSLQMLKSAKPQHKVSPSEYNKKIFRTLTRITKK